jgi:hypothetical protein
MKLFLQILLLLLSWFPNLIIATPKLLGTLDNPVKIIFETNAYRNINTDLVLQKFKNVDFVDVDGVTKTGTIEIVQTADNTAVGWRVVVNNVGSLWKTFLDDAFVAGIKNDVITNITLGNQFPNLSGDELTAIKVYTSDQIRNGSKIYQTLNTELRAGNLSDYNKGLNDLVNSGLSKLPQHNGNVFRGVYGQEATLAKTWQVGDEIPFKDFKSSSTSKEIAVNRFADQNGGDVFYEIIGGKGANVCGVSCMQTEMEILLKSNQRFKVKQVQPNHMVFDEDFQIQKPFTRIVLEIVQ